MPSSQRYDRLREGLLCICSLHVLQVDFRMEPEDSNQVLSGCPRVSYLFFGSQPWYHQLASRSSAEQLLAGTPTGTIYRIRELSATIL
jgi:hypothetical protein